MRTIPASQDAHTAHRHRVLHARPKSRDRRARSGPQQPPSEALFPGMRDPRAKGQSAGGTVRLRVMVEVGVVRIHDERLVDAAEGSFETDIIREGPPGAPCEIPAPASPCSWCTRSNPRAAASGRCASAARWRPASSIRFYVMAAAPSGSQRRQTHKPLGIHDLLTYFLQGGS